MNCCLLVCWLWEFLRGLFFLLLVSVPPQIEGNSLMFGVQEEKLRINGSLTLSCLTKGFPEPKVQWFRDGQVGSGSLILLLSEVKLAA